MKRNTLSCGAVALILFGCSFENTDFELETESTQASVRSASHYDAAVTTRWYRQLLEMTRSSPGFSPPVASRAFGYVGVALYEALQPGMREHRSLAGQLNGLAGVPSPAPGSYHWPAVANATLARMARGLYPVAPAEQLATVDSLELELAQQFRGEASAPTLARSRDWGVTIADAILAWSVSDGAEQCYENNFPTDYTPPEGFGYWVPTENPDGTLAPGALQPFWGENRPFVLPSGNPNAECDPGPHVRYEEQEGTPFWNEMLEVYDAVRNVTPEQANVAYFWSDDPGKTFTPPGHSVAILTQLLEYESSDLGFAAEAYAKLGVAVADAFIACWESKYRYNLVRPLTCINQLIDETWRPLLPTPPFPEYTSGHSVQSGAAFLVLTDLFGPDYAFTDDTHADHPDKAVRPEAYASRRFASFDAAAEEAAISRLYGGIHYRSAIERGLTQGRCVGRSVLGLQFVDPRGAKDERRAN